jgi:diguanylate cyclase (GGDEF)-like protein
VLTEVETHPEQNWESVAVTALLATVQRRVNAEEMEMPLYPDHDCVTGLLSRARLETSAADLFASAQLYKAPISVVLVDVDKLSAINTSFGPEAGDAVLAHVAKLMLLNIQPGVDLAGRLAGATMMLVLPEADYAWASSFAERLRGTLANRPLAFGEHMIEASACFGVASIVPRDISFADLRRRAEKALSLVKTDGPNLVGVAAEHGQFAA